MKTYTKTREESMATVAVAKVPATQVSAYRFRNADGTYSKPYTVLLGEGAAPLVVTLAILEGKEELSLQMLKDAGADTVHLAGLIIEYGAGIMQEGVEYEEVVAKPLDLSKPLESNDESFLMATVMLGLGGADSSSDSQGYTLH